jgi:uncharacterized protein
MTRNLCAPSVDMYKLNKYTWTLNLGGGNYLLYNSLFQKAARIDEELRFLLKSVTNPDELTEHEDVAEMLKEMGVLLPENFDEITYLRTLFKDVESTFDISYESFIFLLTWDCNSDCTFCLEKKHRTSIPERDMTAEMVENAFIFMDKFKREPIKSLEISGGEPLLLKNRKIVDMIVERARKRGLNSLTITTNGVTIQEYTDLLLKYEDTISLVRTTLDGLEEYHDRRRGSKGVGSYDRIVQGITSLINKGFDGKKIHITVRFDKILAKKIDKIIETFETLQFIGKIGITFSTINNFGVNPQKTTETNEEIWRDFIAYFKEHDELLKYMNVTDETKTAKIIIDILIKGTVLPVNPFGCGGLSGISSAVFAPDGKVYFCMVPAGMKEYSLGEYYPEIAVSEEAVKSIRKRTFFTLEECHECKFMPVCSGGCPYADKRGITCLAKSLFEEEISQFFYQYMRPQKMMK